MLDASLEACQSNSHDAVSGVITFFVVVTLLMGAPTSLSAKAVVTSAWVSNEHGSTADVVPLAEPLFGADTVVAVAPPLLELPQPAVATMTVINPTRIRP